MLPFLSQLVDESANPWSEKLQEATGLLESIYGKQGSFFGITVRPGSVMKIIKPSGLSYAVSRGIGTRPKR